eukprot:gnl/Carplike_NY0171/14859_a22068_110.p1 GENE.gnl/Carplike_NY0171/14859_a22068_110~~gnl/Carplike_NY0171/14859_a22068_110.p1  ORF type:complete len:171 (+),score=33.68 gnl/Carplike_NY0171/14859_a22068_110:48-560(+)
MVMFIDFIESVKKGIETSLDIEPLSLRHSYSFAYPEVEIKEDSSRLLAPLEIKYQDIYEVLIERAVDSVRISIKVRMRDEDIEKSILDNFSKEMHGLWSELPIIRKKPVKGYFLSFLILHHHIEEFSKNRIVFFISTILQDLSREISALKIATHSQIRRVADALLQDIIL